MSDHDWLKAAAKPYADLSVGLLDPYMVVDHEGVIVRVSQPIKAIIAKKPKKAIGLSIDELLSFSILPM